MGCKGDLFDCNAHSKLPAGIIIGLLIIQFCDTPHKCSQSFLKPFLWMKVDHITTCTVYPLINILLTTTVTTSWIIFINFDTPGNRVIKCTRTDLINGFRIFGHSLIIRSLCLNHFLIFSCTQFLRRDTLKIIDSLIWNGIILRWFVPKNGSCRKQRGPLLYDIA